jgi:hypothetical protein
MKKGNAAQAVGRCGCTLQRSFRRKQQAPSTCDSSMIFRPSRTQANVSGSPSMSICSGSHHSTNSGAVSPETASNRCRSACVNGTRALRQHWPHCSQWNSSEFDERWLTSKRLRQAAELKGESTSRSAREETLDAPTLGRSPSRRGCQRRAPRRQMPSLAPPNGSWRGLALHGHQVTVDPRSGSWSRSRRTVAAPRVDRAHAPCPNSRAERRLARPTCWPAPNLSPRSQSRPFHGRH